MKSKKLRINDKGYLLLESSIALTIIATILLVLYPLIVDWLILRDHVKENVEDTRVLYEHSMQWPQIQKTDNNYLVKTNDTSLTVIKNNQSIGVEIYEVEFD